MRIAMDGLPLTQRLTGVGHYTEQIASNLAAHNPADEISLVSPRRFLYEKAGQANLRYLRPTANPLRRLWWRRNLSNYLGRSRTEVFHGTNFELPWKSPCPTVVTIHDLSTLLYPQYHLPKNSATARERLSFAARSATLVVTPTDVVRSEVHEHLQVPLDKIFAVSEAARSCFHPATPADSATLRHELGLGERFLLYVGTVEPRKNLSELLKAFEEVGRIEPDLQLVIVGGRGWLMEDFFAAVGRSHVRDRIIFGGYRSDETLRSLYSSSLIFIYPSLYEGFGLPPLEAMACGAPVITSDIPSIKEVVGEGACVVNPVAAELSHAIRSLLHDKVARAQLAEAGRRRAAQFSWLEAAKQMRDVYGEAIKRWRA